MDKTGLRNMNPEFEIPAALIDGLKSAEHIAVLTGAGVSSESGIPTFRDAMSGLWAKYKPEELATPEAFQRNPALVWSWYQWRRQMVETKQPNAGHRALVEFAALVPRMTLITQNVDGLHQLAGSRDVIELHGNIRRNVCFQHRHPAEHEPVSVKDCSDADQSTANKLEEGRFEAEDFSTGGNQAFQPPPVCRECGSPMRPDVIWFGELLNSDYLRAATTAACSADVFFSVGTSSLVHPAAELPNIAARSGATVVEINTNPTPLTGSADYALHGRGGEVLPAICRLWAK